MASTAFIVEHYVCPTIGAILSNIAFAAPITSLRAAVKVGNLADLNPTPWAFMMGNTVGWLAYSFITGDLFVFFANVFGVLISIYLNIGAMKLQYYEEVVSSIQMTGANTGENAAPQDESEGMTESTENETEVKRDQELRSFTSHEIKVLVVVVTWILILSVTSLISATKEKMENVVGISVNINLVLFYGGECTLE
jgi:solute carrier family 50 protein (sugar transporter)